MDFLGLGLLVYQYRHTAVDRLREFRIALRTEDWAGAGVGVQECKILGSEGEAALFVVEVFDAVGEKDELGSVHHWLLQACKGEQAEFHSGHRHLGRDLHDSRSRTGLPVIASP